MTKTTQSREHTLLVGLLYEVRREAKVSQGELARLLDQNQGWVSRIECGERRIDMVEVFHWCQALDVDFTTFCHRFRLRVEREAASLTPL